MFFDITEVFTSITRIPQGIRIELNPERINDVQTHRYRLGFCMADQPEFMWPRPMRNLNNTGKLMLPNYAGPALPETIGDFVLKLTQEGSAGGNYIDAMIPGVPYGEELGELQVCVIDPDDREFAAKPLHAMYFIGASH